MPLDLTWIKVSLGLFDDDKIKIIESMPDKDTLLVIWVKLLIQAGKSNAGGYIQFSEAVPYTDEMLASVFNRPLNTIRLALATFQKFKMIEIDTQNGIYLTNWAKYQNIETMDMVREKSRIRSREYRQRLKDKLLLSQNIPTSRDEPRDNVTSPPCDESVTSRMREESREGEGRGEIISTTTNMPENKTLPLDEKIALVSTIFENEVGVITPMSRDLIIEIADKYPVEWFGRACKEAIKHNARNIAYIEKILQRWQIQGFDDKKDTSKDGKKIWRARI